MALGAAVAVLVVAGACDSQRNSSTLHTLPDGFTPSMGTLDARLVAVGVHGASGIRQVGAFLDASPILTNGPFQAFTGPGQVLDPSRLLVASSSNYGAPLARTDHQPGSVLSLDIGAKAPIVVPPDFAKGGKQDATLDGAVRVYAAQTANFLNSVYHTDAVTADMPSVSNPVGISINNAFGRPWIANAPTSGGAGTITVLDPDGRPLAAVVSATAGGVFTGTATNRLPQIIPGSLSTGSVGTALLGPSPDGTRRAVFAAATVDGALVQVHVQLGVDGLAPAGTFRPVTQEVDVARSFPINSAVTHIGILFNWVPSKALYVADPLRNAVLFVKLSQDSSLFRVTETTTLTSPFFDDPMDLAPAVMESVSRDFSSGTTLAGGSDFYVLNRGNGTIVRMTQSGQVVAARKVNVPGIGVLERNRLNGIATSGDATRMWLTLSGTHPGFPGAEGLVVEVEAFGAEGL